MIKVDNEQNKAIMEKMNAMVKDINKWQKISNDCENGLKHYNAKMLSRAKAKFLGFVECLESLGCRVSYKIKDGLYFNDEDAIVEGYSIKYVA